MKKTAVKRLLRYAIAVLGGVLIALVGLRLHSIWRHERRAGRFPAASKGFGSVENFSLTDQSGRPYGLNQLRGSYWVADFIFTRCAGPCPVISSKMARLTEEFSQSNLRFVSFSVDPDHDTPEILSAYARTYGADTARWAFLTGNTSDVHSLIRDNFHLAVQEEIQDGRGGTTAVLHSLHFVLVGPDGKIIGYYNSTDPEAVAGLKTRLTRELGRPS